MRVLVLGGTGRFGRLVSRLLATDPLVSALLITGRDEARAQAVAGEIGPKARGTSADVDDPGSLDRLLAGADLVANATGPYFRTLLPVLDAALRNRVHYCDFAEDWKATEQALERDQEAKAAGITALVGMGDAPGLTNLLAVQAARRLDRVETVELGWYIDVEAGFGTVRENLERCRRGQVGASLQAIIEAASGHILAIREGATAFVEACTETRSIPLPDGTTVAARPYGTSEPLTLHRALPEAREITSLVGLQPPAVLGAIQAAAERISLDGLDPSNAAVCFYESLAVEPERWLAGERDPEAGGVFASIVGLSNGRRVRVSLDTAGLGASTVPAVGHLGTAGPFGLGALKILSGEVSERGVLSPERVFEADPFLTDLACRWSSWDGRQPLIRSRVGVVRPELNPSPMR